VPHRSIRPDLVRVTDRGDGSAVLSPVAARLARPPKLGLDVYSLRSSGWDACTTLDYCAGLGAEVVHFSEPRFLGSLDDANLDGIRGRADDLGLELEVGMGSICPSSTMFRGEEGTATEQLTRMLHVAKRLRSTIIRCYVGSFEDRGPELGAHVDRAIATCRAVESIARDLGIMIAVENHAGDLLSVELRDLVERAGPQFVGVLFDAGNAAWTLEEPIAALERLAPFVLTSGIRDSRVWETQDGAMVEWVPLGDGDARIEELARRYAALCPGRPFSLEIIVYEPVEIPFRRQEFAKRYPDVPAWVVPSFAEWARSATIRHGAGASVPIGDPITSAAEAERAAVETSMAYARTVLGLGRQADQRSNSMPTPSFHPQ
jgi:3-oxoisoapionate decarboxylase